MHICIISTITDFMNSRNNAYKKISTGNTDGYFLWVTPKDMSLYCYALSLRVSAKSSGLGVVC